MMNGILRYGTILLLSGLLLPVTGVLAQAGQRSDSLPRVFGKDQPDIIAAGLKADAAFFSRSQQLPVTLEGWKEYRAGLKKNILQKAAVSLDHSLPLNCRETGSIKLNGYTVKNIWFQTRPGVYATANLYVPDGKGPFPAVINMHGHWPDGRMGEMVQSCGHTLALHGYVCLNIDCYGAGERTTLPGVAEYHGANLGASLLNIGETLLGDQLSDNMRGVDLLCSLPYVDTAKIGATGASGGGNQTMWLAAMDERIKAAMPVVSVGTFESYIMNSNCVCELLPDGLTFMEEAGVLGLIAPRALKIGNALQDASPTFKPAEMLRSYHNTASVFSLYGKADNLQYELFNTGHGYWPEMRQALLGWLDWKLKGHGTGAAQPEAVFQLLPVQQLLVFPPGKRDTLVTSIADHCRLQGRTLKNNLLRVKRIDTTEKKNALTALLRLPQIPAVSKVRRYQPEKGWDRIVLQTDDRRLIPLLHHAPAGSQREYVLLIASGGKGSIPSALVEEYERRGTGILIADIWGTGECISPAANGIDGSLPRFHTLARSEFWLGKSVMGEWVTEMAVLTRYMKTTWRPVSLTIDASKEPGIAALFHNALEADADTVILRNCPVSYVFDQRSGIDYFNMAIHIPGILQWGDISLAAALSGKRIVFINPVSMSGRPVGEADQWNLEFSTMRALCRETGVTLFTNN